MALIHSIGSPAGQRLNHQAKGNPMNRRLFLRASVGAMAVAMVPFAMPQERVIASPGGNHRVFLGPTSVFKNAVVTDNGVVCLHGAHIENCVIETAPAAGR